ncbi:MAG: hypothetical protein IJY44_08085 [Bacteroidaceae bacterium]|nr:hypothetical protein [Bacteroidaceae bacterium]
MKNTLSIIIALFGFTAAAVAQNWDQIRNSGKYYYGEGFSDTVEKAKEMALSSLTGMIATNVSSDFQYLLDEKNTNGDIDHESKVLNCIKTYSQATLTNVKTWQVSDPPECVIRCYMECAEMERIFESRILKAKEYLKVAEEYLKRQKIDAALKYCYWAYSLICSVQFPNNVKDDAGNVLAVSIPQRIEEIIDGVKVTFDKRTDNYVDFLFTYGGEPVSSIEFTYNNGQDLCLGKAKDGRGMVEVRSSHEGKVYHINVEYEFKEHARGDVELESVLNVIPKKMIPTAAKKVIGSGDGNSVAGNKVKKEEKIVNSQKLKPAASQLAVETDRYKAAMEAVLNAISARRYSDIGNFTYFSLDGLEVYNKLIAYGTARVVGIPSIQFFKGLDDCVVARGLQMSFSFNRGKKQTFVEDVIFYFDKEGKIDNISFGLGIDVTNEILSRSAKGWGDDAREILLEFLENYKTAYALERLDYIKSIFSDDAQIITGKVLKVKPGFNPANEKNISIEGQKAIEYTHLTKKDYIERLKRVFANNEFININFSNTSIRKITKIADKEKFVIQLAQEYNSSIYSDKGYLLLLVDITNKEEPLIEIRTWQPDEIDMDNVFHEGMFYTN